MVQTGFYDNTFTAGDSATSPIVKGGNLQISSNSLISTNTNGNIVSSVNGTGEFQVYTGATDSFRFNTTGAMRALKQPYTRSRPPSGVTDVTGDGTDYLIVFSSVSLNTGEYNTTTGLITCSELGTYIVRVKVDLAGILSTHTSLLLYMEGVTGSNTRNTNLWQCNPYKMADASGQLLICGCTQIVVSSTAMTRNVRLIVSGGTKVVDIGASGSQITIIKII